MSGTDSGNLEPLRGRAVYASAGVFAALLGPVAMAASTVTFGAGRDTVEVKVGAGLFIGGILYLLLLWPLFGVLVIRWLVRARANAELLSPTGHRLSARWAVAGWFVPLANAVLPLLVVIDVVRASGPDGRGSRATGVWWASWLVAWSLLLVGLVAAVGLDAPDGRNVLRQCLLSAMTLFITSALSFRVLVLAVADSQDAHVAEPA
ncbi:DUF4328 domain-containing protein [Nocardia takedensis]